MKSQGHFSRGRRGARLGVALLLAIGIGGAQGRQDTFSSRSSDPLTMPRPELAEPLILPIDGRTPAAKIVATMPAALRRLEDPSSIGVVVSLHEPLESNRRGAAPRGRLDPVRRARIAAVEQDFATAAARLGFRATRGLTHFAIVAGEISPDRLGHLAALPQVRAIEPDRSFRAARVEGAGLIRADDLRDDFGGAGAGVTVVVLDSGINANHPELAGKVVEQHSFNGPMGQDGFNHGTQVAGIIAGDGGLAPEAELWDVRVIGNDGLTTVAILIDALDFLMPHMDQFEILVGAFADPNFQFSSSCDQLNPGAAQVVQEFRDAGNLLIAAAGEVDPNRPEDLGVGVPACLDAILAAGAVYDADIGPRTFFGCTDNATSADKIACYSNSGPLLDFLAPGHCTTTPRASGGLDNCFGGTSAATAYAGGVAAQLWSLRPSATVGQIENALTNQGTPINDARNGITRPRINAVAGLQSLPAGPGPTATVTSPAPGPSPTPTKTPTGPTPTKTPTPPSGNPPAAPSNLTAQALTHSAVLLQWADNSNNEAAFLIEGRTPAGQFQELATVPANTNFAAVEELFSSTNYTFRVRARSASGNSSPYSSTANATTAATTAACVPDANTACLLGGKFRITGAMKDFSVPPVTFDNQVMSFAGGRAESDQAVFFESFTPGNFEVGVKMVDACSFPPGNPVRNYWVFAGGLTNAKTDITVQDTVTAATFTWHNPAGQFPTSIGNTMAFPCTNPGGTPNCTRNDNTACLIGGRFRVTGTMQDFNVPPVTFSTKVIQFAQNRAETDQAVFHQSFNPGNFEVGVKMVDACSFPPGNPVRAYWIFYGGLTNAEAEVRAVHTATGRVDLWRNPAQTFPTSVGNTAAFPCP